jgi:glycosyltransferase involved in cell wall biosynthesis
MRILFLNPRFPPDNIGGAEVSLYHTGQGLLAQGVVCQLLAISNLWGTDRNEWYHLDYLPVHRVGYALKLPQQALFDPRIYRAVRREIRTFQPDLVHIHNISCASLAPYLACHAEQVPVVNTLHDLWLLCPNNMRYRQDGSFCDPAHFPDGCRHCFRRYDYWAVVPQRRRLFHRLTRTVNYFISPSQALIERHVEAGYARQRFRLVPYGFAESGLVAPHHPAVAQVVNTAHQERTLIFAGGGNENKGAQTVIDALPTLLSAVENLRVIVAGGGEDHFFQQFQAHAPAVKVLGRLPFPDMRALFAAADLTLIPSTWHENSPVVIYENFQMGTPVVGSNFGGTPELIDEGRTGYTFPAGNAQAMAEKILGHFAKSPVERRQMRQNCVQAVRSKFGLAAHVAAHQQIYAEVCHDKMTG